jgi:UDP-N-acetylglucosamine diphosphorylase/glucosamine-1-phosphate N-acetyltransferase
MFDMRVCLFEDEAGSLDPLTLTRPAFDLWCGQTTLGFKQWRHFTTCAGAGATQAASPTGVLIRPQMAQLFQLGNPRVPVNDVTWLRAEATILVNGRWLPPAPPAAAVNGPCVGLVDDQVAYAVVDRERLQYCLPDTLADCLATWKRTLPCHAARGTLISYPWDLVHHNAEQLSLDFQHTGRPGCAGLPLTIVGPPERIVVDPSARIDPMVVADTTAGPVVIDREAVITAFTRLEGPCYIGPNTHLFGAKIRAGTTLGPHCRIGGEIEASIVHGYSNKYHDGFLGHSYIGEWLNLGAGTHNSDLRNDYGPVTVISNGRAIDTGLNKVGCFIGDHTKTGLGTLLNTGTNIGAFCNLLPAGPLAPKYMPSFTTWWNGTLRANGDWLKLLATAREVMQRRGCALTDAHAALYTQVYEETELERRRGLREFEQRRLRRSA